MVSGSAVQKHRKEYWTKDGDLGIMLSMEVVRGVELKRRVRLFRKRCGEEGKRHVIRSPGCPDNSRWAEGDELAKELRKSSSRCWMKIREEPCYGGKQDSAGGRGSVTT